MKFFLTVIASAGTLLLAASVLTGVTIEGVLPAFLAALVLGILNALVRPILIFLTFPINIVTLGLFTFVINALLVWAAASLITGIAIAGFWWAFLAALLISIVTALVDSLEE
ncbi:MAG: phage holin family protein [Candidatus Paceibacterota bacterium]